MKHYGMKLFFYLLSFIILIGNISIGLSSLIVILLSRFILVIVFGLIGLLRLLSKMVQTIGNELLIKPIYITWPKLFVLRRYFKISVLFSFLKIRFFYFLLGVLMSLIIYFFYSSYLFINDLPNPKLIGNVNYPVSTELYDRNGNLLYEIFRDKQRTPIELEDLPKYVLDATVAIEDKDFYTHKGISLISGIARAIRDSLRTGRLYGGSTITQQLVKTSLLTPERTIERKIREVIIALWAENIYSKDQIFEMYLNQVAYGGSAYGIEEASKTYFRKPASQLDLDEAAFLAGLPKAPSYYSPYNNPQLAKRRRNEVMRSMLLQGYINDVEYEKYIEKPLLVQPPNYFIKAPHFTFYVKAYLEKLYGIGRVEEGGLRVITTLDLNLQDRVQGYLVDELSKLNNMNITNGAVLITVPSTGEIISMIGSKDYFEKPYGAYNVTTALRQPGSSIKPLMYSLALQRGYSTATIINDSPIAFYAQGSKPYRPVNYDGRYHGSIPLRYALANSYNVPAVKVLYSIGTRAFVDHASSLGITTFDTPDRYGLSLTLGGAEVKMTDMAVAYGVFANYGEKVLLDPLISVEDYKGDSLFEKKVEKVRVLPERIAFLINNILSDNFARRDAFGDKSLLEIPGYQVAVKTGTTNLKRDNVAIGYTRDYLISVWVGNNDNSPMNPTLTSGVTGAAPIWNRAMIDILENGIVGVPANSSRRGFPTPTGIITRKCFFGRDEYFISSEDGAEACNINNPRGEKK